MSKKPIPYRRVLTISNVPVTAYSAQGASRGSWFKDWDKDALAMMTFAKADESNDFAGFKFDITLNERFGGWLFKKIARPAVYQENPAQSTPESNSISKSSPLKTTLKMLAGLFMYPIYSKRLKAFLKTFRPEIIFSTVADCYGARLVRFIANKLHIPYIIQQEDNWLVSDAKGLIKPLAYCIRKHCLKQSLKGASKRYVICPSMKDYFEELFCMPFESLFCADEPSRFLKPVLHDSNKKTVFLYIGNSRPGRSGEYIKIAEAIKQSGIKNPEFRIYSSNAYQEDITKLAEFGFVTFYDIPHHEDVPKTLAQAHVLVLVESFDPHAIEYTRLALSSKVQIYMMAKIPILVFASPKTGLMNYALKTGFGLTVTEDNAAMLNQAVYKIVNDASLRKNLVNRAYDVALKNHHAAEIRKKLKETLNQICENNESLRL